MHALELQRLAGPDGFAYVERPDPVAGDGVLIDVRACGVSFPDLLMAHGRYQVKPDLPYVPGQEVAGVVVAAPAGSGVAAGDRVWASVEGGGLASRVVAPARSIQPLPPEVSFVEGAALGVNFTTAAFALRERDVVRAGETVVVLGAAGGLGTALVACAKAYGARVLAVVSEADKAATASTAGADAVLVGEGFRDAVLAETGGRGADVVCDVVGGDATLQAVRSCAPRGRVLVLGFTSGGIAEIGVNRLLLRNVTLVGAGLGALDASDPSVLPAAAAEVTRLLGEGVRPIIGAEHPLADGADALRALDERRAHGKLVLLPS